jgi:hypothetical protein
MATQDDFTKSHHVDDPTGISLQVVHSRLACVFTNVLGGPWDCIHPDLGPRDVEKWDSSLLRPSKRSSRSI